MSVAHEIIREAKKSDIVLYVENGKLAFVAKHGGFPQKLKESISSHKNEIISALLSSDNPVEDTVDVEPFSLIKPEERPGLMERYEDAYPLSALQAGMVFHTQLEQFSGIYHDIMRQHLRCPWDEGCFREALSSCITEHPVLRTGFLMDGDWPLQVVYGQRPLPLQVLDIQHLPAAQQEEHLGHWSEEHRHHVFDWEHGPLFQIHIFRRSPESFEFVMSFHHAVLDGWSRATLSTQLYQRYRQRLSGQVLGAAPVNRLYRQFIAQERQVIADPGARDYFAQMLEGAHGEQLPRRPPGAGAGRDQHQHVVAGFAERSARLLALSRQLGVPLQTLVLTLHLKVLSSLSGDAHVLSCVTQQSRPESAGGEKALGLFLNSVPMALQLREGSWRELIGQVGAGNTASIPYRSYPLSRIQQELRIGFSEVTFNYTHYHVFGQISNEVGNDLQVLGTAGFEQTNFDLVVDVGRSVQGEQLWLTLVYDAQVFETELIERYGEYFVRACEWMLQDVEAAHHTRSLLGEKERQQVLALGAGAQAPYPTDLCLQELFEAQVQRTPGALAVLSAEQQLSYGQLNEQANRLAHYLRSLGVRADERVGVCMHRCAQMVVGILGVLKAGGAYVPLDPDYPQERVDFMIRDSALRMLLTHSAAQRPYPQDVRAIRLDDEQVGAAIGACQSSNPDLQGAGVSATNLAYVMYTSGSSGTPKGVMVEHAGVVNRLLWAKDEYAVTAADRILHKTPFTFDVSVWELLLPLLCGARLVVARPGGHQEPDYLAELLLQAASQ